MAEPPRHIDGLELSYGHAFRIGGHEENRDSLLAAAARAHRHRHPSSVSWFQIGLSCALGSAIIVRTEVVGQLSARKRLAASRNISCSSEKPKSKLVILRMFGWNPADNRRSNPRFCYH